MAHYFCVDHGYFEHLKTRRLIKREGDVAALVPLKLWRYASMCQADGDLSNHSIDELCEIVDMANVHQVKKILITMRDVGFFEAGTWKLHDFEEYNAYATKRKLAAKKAAIARWRDSKGTTEALTQEKAPPRERGEGDSSPPNASTRPRAKAIRSATKEENNPSAPEIKGNSRSGFSASQRAFALQKLLNGQRKLSPNKRTLYESELQRCFEIIALNGSEPPDDSPAPPKPAKAKASKAPIPSATERKETIKNRLSELADATYATDTDKAMADVEIRSLLQTLKDLESHASAKA